MHWVLLNFCCIKPRLLLFCSSQPKWSIDAMISSLCFNPAMAKCFKVSSGIFGLPCAVESFLLRMVPNGGLTPAVPNFLSLSGIRVVCGHDLWLVSEDNRYLCFIYCSTLPANLRMHRKMCSYEESTGWFIHWRPKKVRNCQLFHQELKCLPLAIWNALCHC